MDSQFNGGSILLKIILCVALLLSASACDRDEDSDSPQFIVVESDKPVLHILEDAEFAITERNFRINNRLHIGKAIRERGSTGFPDHEVILFCSLGYAKRMLELVPEFIRYCPQRLAVYDRGDKRVIAASLYPENTSTSELNKVTREVNAEVSEIVNFAATEWPELERSADEEITR